MRLRALAATLGRGAAADAGDCGGVDRLDPRDGGPAEDRSRMLPTGAVVLPGLDTRLDDESWNATRCRRMRNSVCASCSRIMGVERADVAPWPPLPADRADRARSACASLPRRCVRRRRPMRGAICSTNDGGAFKPRARRDLSLVEAATPREEALAIAIALREALETPGRTAALVTPDRGLARRVAAELTRWDIAIDDSAGQKLSRTPPGAFLALLARAAAEDFAPVAAARAAEASVGGRRSRRASAVPPPRARSLKRQASARPSAGPRP